MSTTRSTTNDFYTTALGDDANSGLFPDQPKADVASILSSYTLGPNDLVLIDTGTYNTTGLDHFGQPGGGIRRRTDPGRVLPTGSDFTYGGTVFELANASFNLFEGLVFSGSGTGIYAHGVNGQDSIRNVIEENTFSSSYAAVDIDGGNSDVISGNTISGGGSYGIELTSGTSAAVSGNTISGRSTAIYESLATATIDGNSVSNGNYGVYVGAGRASSPII